MCCRLPEFATLPAGDPASLDTLIAQDNLTKSYDPACSEIVILESEPEPKDADDADDSMEMYHQAVEKLDSLHPLSMSEPVPMPRMALVTASQEPMNAPSPPFAGLPVTKGSLTIPVQHSKSTPPTISTSKESGSMNLSTSKESESLNLSEELDEGARRKLPSAMAKSPPYAEDLTSDGFTTADFYIDESMPSSMTDSNSRRVTELQQVISEKSALLEVRENELCEQRRRVEILTPQLLKAKESFKSLHDLVEKGTLQLKCEVLSIEKQMQKEKDESQAFAATISKTIFETIERFEREQAEKFHAELEELKTSHEAERSKWESQLELEVSKHQDSQQQLDSYQSKFHQHEEELETLKREYVKHQEEAKQKAEEELLQTKNQLVLEHELELEKVRSDLDADVERKSAEITRLEKELKMNDQTIKDLTEKLNSIREQIEGDFAKEKQLLAEALEKEADEKALKAVKEHEEAIKLVHRAEIEAVKASQQKALEEEMEKLQKTHEEKLKSVVGEKDKAYEELESSHKCTVNSLEGQLSKLQVDYEQNQQAANDLKTEQDSVQEKIKKSMAELEKNLQEALSLKETAIREKEDVEVKLNEEKEQLLNKNSEISKEVEEYKVKCSEIEEKLLREVDLFSQEKEDSAKKFDQMHKEMEKDKEAIAHISKERDEMLKDWIKPEKHGELVAELQAALEAQKKADIAEVRIVIQMYL